MKRSVVIGLSLLAWTAMSLVPVRACYVSGTVKCENNWAIPGVQILLDHKVNNVWVRVGSLVTDSAGHYETEVYAGDYRLTIVLTDDYPVLVSPCSADQVINGAPYYEPISVDWVVDGPACAEGACWFTGGGAKIDSLLNQPVAETGNRKLHSFGGNVYPGCSPTAGDGGSWNHIARGTIKLHFHGTSIVVVKCGNVTPPPPEGSDSPETPYNYIEFTGTGTLKGISGNKADYGTVNFYARAEDRNEPGSSGANDGALIDRYYLRVYDNAGTTLLLVANTADPTVPPEQAALPITAGNFQLHCSSCDNPPAL